MTVKEAVVASFMEILKERNMRPNELANLSGITPSTVYSMLDSRRKELSINVIKKLCDGLDMKLGEFFNAPIFDELEQEIRYYNPMDTYWRSIYKNFGHSYATGGQKITFYRWDYAHDLDYVVRTYCHEAGHYIDQNMATSTSRFSAETIWTKAMADDRIVSGKNSCTIYGENSATEDFAESIAE